MRLNQMPTSPPEAEVQVPHICVSSQLLSLAIGESSSQFAYVPSDTAILVFLPGNNAFSRDWTKTGLIITLWAST